MNIENNGYLDPDLISFEAVKALTPDNKDDVFLGYIRFWKANKENGNPVEDGKSFCVPVGAAFQNVKNLTEILINLYFSFCDSTVVSYYVPIFDVEEGNAVIELNLQEIIDNDELNTDDENAQEETKPDSEGTVDEQVSAADSSS